MKKLPQWYLALFLAFLLGNYRGYVALWIDESQVPEVVFPCRTESLPPADILALKKGIHLETEEALNSLLEDYLS